MMIMMMTMMIIMMMMMMMMIMMMMMTMMMIMMIIMMMMMTMMMMMMTMMMIMMMIMMIMIMVIMRMMVMMVMMLMLMMMMMMVMMMMMQKMQKMKKKMRRRIIIMMMMRRRKRGCSWFWSCKRTDFGVTSEHMRSYKRDIAHMMSWFQISYIKQWMVSNFRFKEKHVFNISLGKKMQKRPSSLFSLARLRVRIRSLAASILPFASTATFEDFEQSLMALMGGFSKMKPIVTWGSTILWKTILYIYI